MTHTKSTLDAAPSRQYTKVAIPPRIWIDTEGLPDAYARGYDQYFLASYDSRYGPRDDGKSIEYIQRVDALREAAALQCQFCKRPEQYGVAELNTEYHLFAHLSNGARWCNANNIQHEVARAALALATQPKD